jgi:hypothetical protein
MSATKAIFPGVKVGNEYASVLGDLYTDIPKAVFAAMAVSALTCGGDHIEEAQANIVREWWALYNSGVVTQKPTRASDG